MSAAKQQEIAAEFECSPATVVRSLSAVGYRLESKPFGMRPVSVTLSRAQVEGLWSVADRQGIRGNDRHLAIAKQALRRLGADPDLLAGILDPSMRPLLLPGHALQPLKAEAKKRGITVSALAVILLVAIGRDGIGKASWMGEPTPRLRGGLVDNGDGELSSSVPLSK